jgi:hypothetical protein
MLRISLGNSKVYVPPLRGWPVTAVEPLAVVELPPPAVVLLAELHPASSMATMSAPTTTALTPARPLCPNNLPLSS